MIQYKLIMYIALAAALSYSGWQTRAWYDDSRALVAEEARQDVLNTVRLSVAAVNKRVEATLADTKIKERVIDRGVIREVQKTVYRDRVCFDDALIGLLNDGAKGGSASIPGIYLDEVPGATTTN